MPNKNADVIQLEVGVKVLLYFKKANKYLVLQRAQPYPGEKYCKWDVPGGRIIPGEPLVKALKREVKEETGLAVKKIDKILLVQDILRVKSKHTVRVTFLAETSSDRVRLDQKEHQAFQWLTLPEIAKLKHDIYIKPVLEEMEGSKVFSKKMIKRVAI